MKFRENFKASSNFIIFPIILYQSKDVLISEYIDGKSMYELTDIQKYHCTMNFICFFYQMLFVDNFIHGDLHCKNWKVRIHNTNTTTNNIQLVIYDCGICFTNIDVHLSIDLWFSLIKYDIDDSVKVINKLLYNINPNYSNINLYNNELICMFKKITNNSMSASITINTTIAFFKLHNLTVPKFLLNLSILVCVCEEFFKSNGICNKNKNHNINVNMFDVINDMCLDIIAYCDVKKCYPDVRTLFVSQMKTTFKDYTKNITKINDESNLIVNDTNINKQKLFSSILLSGLTFKPPG